MHHALAGNASPHEIILDAIHHLDHVLPGQGPIHDFVHHNTLHGFQHLPFEQALAEFTQLTGISCYLSTAKFREFYAQGRITDEDIDAALDQQFATELETVVCSIDGMSVTRQMLFRLALLNDLPVLSPAQFDWQVRELGVLDKPTTTGEAARELWNALLAKLGLQMPDLHPEDLLDLSAEQIEQWSPGSADTGAQQMRQSCTENLAKLFSQVGDNITLRGLLLALTGKDILDSVRPTLIRLCASLLDEGLAAWRLPKRQELGLYQAWRESLIYDAQPIFQELNNWQAVTAALPADAIDAIAQQLTALAVPEQHWAGYLQRLALELPGWSGLINWRQTHPNYQADDATKPLLADYLAIRLTLDRLYAEQLCCQQWHCEAQLDKLRGYFAKNLAEFSVRQTLFQGQLPEYLALAAQSLANETSRDKLAWQTLAERIWTWQLSPLAPSDLSVYHQGWRLFRVCQLLGLSASDVKGIAQAPLLACLDTIDALGEHERNTIWLNAYERHYQQALLQALHANHGRGRWARRDSRPEAQVFFCMDEREESFRRHLEELSPQIETLGAAGFFGVAMNYKALDDHHVTPLCPVVVTPVHQVDEVAVPGHEQQLIGHKRGLRMANQLSYLLYQGIRVSPLRAYPLTYILAPLKLWRLLAKSLLPSWQRRLEHGWQALMVPAVPTHLHFTATDNAHAASTGLTFGFTDREQADRVAQFLRTTGLTYGFARIVAILGHGSTSQNNPHEAAHDCGACGGRRGGPNARVFAAMANRREVRDLLKAAGIEILDDTWFIGAQHDTCSDLISWYDLDQVPENMQPSLQQVQNTLAEADRSAAAERCRRFASSGYPRTAQAALLHVENRAVDLSQVRPEFGHATNAAAFIGRRAATQGVFFDRRLFLISYDPSQDPDGTILETILLTAGPVGAGINLEYYFSTVNNDRLGCGTKIPHNVTGLFGVMEGAGGDLRTGLPLQMVEIHEAMRLQIIVEAKTSVLEQIYGRQESLRELIGGGWVHLSAKDPDSGEIFVFQRGIGFVSWQPAANELPLRDNSPDCYRRETQAVPPMLIKQPALMGAG
jgi:uncharacterized protein YbcC (UPF0753/DUF2309 family)